MKLLVDIGNSRIKWARHDAGQTDPMNMFPRHGNSVTGLLDRHWSNLEVPGELLVANVAGPAVADELGQWTLAHWHCEPRFATVAPAACGVTNAYPDPAQLGVDRWLAMIAGRQQWDASFCIIDCGSAVTVDAVDAAGYHLGGLILPGLHMMRTSLDQAPGIRTGATGTLSLALADNTAEAVNAGSCTAIVATIERVLTRLSWQFGDEPLCLLTGGDAEQFLPLIDTGSSPCPIRHEPDLVLQGLLQLFRGDSQ